MMNTLICALDSQYIHSSLAPWCLMAGIRKYGSEKIKAEVFERTVNEDPLKTAEAIISLKPGYIGFCTYIWNISYVRMLLPLIKEKLSDSVIILGGPEAGFSAEKILSEEPLADYVITGEGENSLPILIDSLIQGTGVPEGLGISYRDRGRIVNGGVNILPEEPPSPYTDEYFNSLNGRISYLESSRGCPFSCAFCLSGKGTGLRYYDTARTEKEIIRLANSGTKTVKFIDRTFNSNPDRALKIVKFISDRYGKEIPSGVCFHFEIAGDILRDDLINCFRQMPRGSVQLEIGLQSFNEKTLEAVNRRTDLKKLSDNIRKLVEKRNIHIHIDLIAGLPYEGEDSMRESFNRAYELNPDMLQFGFLKILYGSEMEKMSGRFGIVYSPEPPYEVIYTPWLNTGEMKKMHATADAVDRIYSSGRFRNTEKLMIEDLDITPYDFYSGLSEKLTLPVTPSEIVSLLTEYYAEKGGSRPEKLKDALICDWMACDSSDTLPEKLRTNTAQYGRMLRRFRKTLTSGRQGMRHSEAILSDGVTGVYVIYRDRDPVTHRYTLNFVRSEHGEW
jgi:radical SAM superfamily enzyme YgiQ (UPF0313 family)